MPRSLYIFALLFLLACSKDSPAPTAPAGKVAVLDKPTNLRVEVLSISSAKFSWDAVTGATDYDIYYMPEGGKWVNIPHIGNATFTVVERLEAGVRYLWTVKADHGNDSSPWARGDWFTTRAVGPTPDPTPTPGTTTDSATGPYIRLIYDGTVSPAQKALFRLAVARWNAIVIGGVSGGLTVNVSVEDTGEYRLGTAAIFSYVASNGSQFPTRCRVGIKDTGHNSQMVSTMLHELGHCLGIGAGDTWRNMVRYHSEGKDWDMYSPRWDQPTIDTSTAPRSSNGSGFVGIKYAEKLGPSQPYFVGEAARAEFMRMAGGQWGNHSYVPLYWSREYGSDPAHLDEVLRESVMHLYWEDIPGTRDRVSALEVAILRDLGYRVDSSIADPLKIVAGKRSINRKDYRGFWYYVGYEVLYFPEWKLIFGLGKYDIRGYGMQPVNWVFEDDPSINRDNVVWESYRSAKPVAEQPRFTW